MDIEAKILDFPDLSPDEKAEVEAYVADHTVWKPLLNDVKRLTNWVQDAQALHDPYHDEAIALYAVAQRMHPEHVPSPVAPVFDQIERLLDTDADVRRRYEDAIQRLDDLETAVDPVAHFESLTGHSLSDIADDRNANEDNANEDNADNPTASDPSSPGDPPSPNVTSPSSDATSDASSSPHDAASVRETAPPARDDRNPAQRSSTPIYALGRASRWAVAALLLFTLGYGVLFGISRATEPPLLAMAAMEVDNNMLETYPLRTRGETAAPTSTDKLYLEALRYLKDARESTLGLFPSYDATALQEAETRLAKVVDRTDPNSFLWGEALFYLGKINLAQEDVPTARQALKQVAQSDGRHADAAYDLLVQLQEVDPSSDPAS